MPMAGFDDDQELRGPDFAAPVGGDISRDTVQKQEASPSGDDRYSAEQNRLGLYQPDSSSLGSKSAKRWSSNAQRTIAGAIASGILGLAVFFGIGSLGGMSIVNIDAVARQKFGMSVESILENRQSKIWVKKINTNDKTPSIQGLCGKNIQVACRFEGMSDKEIKKLEERAKSRGHNIKVEASDTKNIFGRRTVSTISVDGNKMSAAEFAADLGKRNSVSQTAMRSVMKPWIAAWAGAKVNNLFSKLGISKAKNVSGATSVEDAKEKIKQNQRGNVDLDVSSRNPVADDNEEEARRAAAANENADKLAGGEPKSSNIGDRIRTNALKNLSSTAQETVTRMAGSVAKGVLITGAIDSACTVVNTVSAIGYMAKYAGALQLIRFAMTFSNVAHATKAGEATTASHEALGAILNTTTATDDRTAADSYGFQYMAYDILGDSTDTAEFKLGGGLPAEMKASLELVDGLTQNGEVCNFIQHPGVRIGSALVGIAAAIFSGGTITVGQVSASVGIAAILSVIQQFSIPLIADMVAGEFVNDSTVGNSSGNALASGYGAFYAQLNNNTGLQVMTTEQAAVFDQTIKADYVAQAKQESVEETGQFDASNPNSFLGSLAMQLMPAINSKSVADLSGKLVSLVANPISKTAQAATDPKAQYEVCTDSDYKRLGIATDPFCNPVYAMSDSALAKDVDEVIAFMYENNYIDSQGNPLGDYGTFMAECVDNTSPFGINNEDTAGRIRPESCIPGKTDRPEEFWIHTVDSRIYEKMQCLIEDDSSACGAAAYVENNAGVCPAGAVGVADIKKGYWDGGYRDATFCAVDNTVDSSMSGIRDADVFRDNNQVLQTNTTGKIVVLDRATADMVELVKKYTESTSKSAFAATFSYRSHNQQCLMFYYTHYSANDSTYSKLPTSCSGISQSDADAMRAKMSGNYFMPKSFYVSDHESGRALDVVDLAWINQCVSGNYDGDGGYASNTCYNFVSAAIPGDLHHVVWKGN